MSPCGEPMPSWAECSESQKKAMEESNYICPVCRVIMWKWTYDHVLRQMVHPDCLSKAGPTKPPREGK